MYGGEVLSNLEYILYTACLGSFGNGFNLLLLFLMDDELVKFEEFALP